MHSNFWLCSTHINSNSNSNEKKMIYHFLITQYYCSLFMKTYLHVFFFAHNSWVCAILNCSIMFYGWHASMFLLHLILIWLRWTKTRYINFRICFWFLVQWFTSFESFCFNIHIFWMFWRIVTNWNRFGNIKIFLLPNKLTTISASDLDSVMVCLRCIFFSFFS